MTPLLEKVLDTDFIVPGSANKDTNKALIEAVIEFEEITNVASEQLHVSSHDTEESLINIHHEFNHSTEFQDDDISNYFEIMF